MSEALTRTIYKFYNIMIIIIIIMIISPNGVIHLFNLMAFWYKNWELETK